MKKKDQGETPNPFMIILRVKAQEKILAMRA